MAKFYDMTHTHKHEPSPGKVWEQTHAKLTDFKLATHEYKTWPSHANKVQEELWEGLLGRVWATYSAHW